MNKKVASINMTLGSIALGCLGLLGTYARAASPTGQASEETSAGVEEILVTATRRSESLQDVPLAVTAINPETAIKLGMRNIKDLQLIVPNTDLAESNGFSQFYIRGIGSIFPTPGLESPVAIYVDGAYIQRSGGFNSLLDMVDPGTIEVLRGPQGTLYGRNATGGVVRLNSALPTQDFDGKVMAEYGRFDHVQVDGMINLPINPELSLRFAGRYRGEDGYIKNLGGGPDVPQVRNWVLRSKLRWQPADSTDIVLGVEYQRNEPRQADAGSLALGSPTCAACNLTGIDYANHGYYEKNTNPTSPWQNKLFHSDLRASFTFGPYSLTSLTTYENDESDQAGDNDFTSLPVFVFSVPSQGGHTYSQEFQLSSNYDGPFNFIAGVNYLRDNGHIEDQLVGSAFPAGPGVLNSAKTDSTSGFVEGSFKVTHELKLTVGGRYTRDKRTSQGSNNAGAQTAFFAPAFFNVDAAFTAFTPRFVIAWDNGTENFYYSYNRGFKAGGFQNPSFFPPAPVGSEKTDGHEVGAKFVTLERRLHVNLAVFYYKNQNIQESIIDPLVGTITENAGAAQGYGPELEIQFAPTSTLSVGGAFSYFHSKFLSYRNASQVCFVPSAAPFTLQSCSLDLTGERLPHSPKYEASLFANYSFPVQTWTANLSGVAQYRSEFDFVPGAGGPLRFDRQSGYAVANFSGYVSPPGGKMRLGFYVDNAFDKKYLVSRTTNTPFGVAYDPAKPITYGLRAQYDF